MKPKVSGFTHDPLVILAQRSDDDLDRFLSHLARSLCRTFTQRSSDVGRVTPFGLTLENLAPQPRREARCRSVVTRGAVRVHPNQHGILITVEDDLDDVQRITRSLSLYPELLARS